MYAELMLHASKTGKSITKCVVSLTNYERTPFSALPAEILENYRHSSHPRNALEVERKFLSGPLWEDPLMRMRNESCWGQPSSPSTTFWAASILSQSLNQQKENEPGPRSNSSEEARQTTVHGNKKPQGKYVLGMHMYDKGLSSRIWKRAQPTLNKMTNNPLKNIQRS